MDANEDLYSDYDYDIGGFGSAPSSNPFQPKTPGFPASRMGTASRLRTAGGSEVRPMTSTTGSGFSSKPHQFPLSSSPTIHLLISPVKVDIRDLSGGATSCDCFPADDHDVRVPPRLPRRQPQALRGLQAGHPPWHLSRLPKRCFQVFCFFERPRNCLNGCLRFGPKIF